MADRSTRPAALPKHLEDALGEALWREPARREERFAELLRAHPEFAGMLRARRSLLLDEGDVSLGGAGNAPQDLTGAILGGKYRILRWRGEGGFGAVWEAVDEMLGASVAVKVLHHDAARDPDTLARFLGEAKVLTNLDHPNVVRWITFDRTREGLHYFVMEYLAGEELSEILKRERQLEPQRVVDILLQVVSALRAAHRMADGSTLLHLDLKPQNVFVLKGTPERVKVIDFGISQHVGAEARAAAGIQLVPTDDVEGLDLSATVTAATPKSAGDDGGVPRARGGTLLYASPEQCRHLAGLPDIVALDGRSDIYSLGIMAFQMLAGELPYAHRATPLAALEAHLKQQPRKFGQLGVKVPRRLEAFVERCLQKDRERRFSDIEDAHAALHRIANPPSRLPWLAAAVALVAALAVVWFWPPRALEPFDVASDGGRVFFGPECAVRRLPVSNLAERDARAEVRLVADVHTHEAQLPGWRARLVEDGARLLVEIEAPRDAETLERPVYLWVAGARDQHSQQLTIAYLGDGAWQVASAGVRELAGRVLDPRGAVLEIAVDGGADAIARVRVTCAGEVRDATRDLARRDGGSAVYTLPLDSFAGLPERGAVRFDVEVVDRAERRVARAVDLEIDARPLELAAELEGCFRARPDFYVVYPNEVPVLVVRANREVGAQRITVRDQAGRELDFGREDGTRGVRILLRPNAAESFVGEVVVEVDDERSVLHAERARGRKTAHLQFLYDLRKPELVVQPDAPRGGSLGDVPVHFTRGDSIGVRLQRNDVRLTVEATCRGAGSDAATQRSNLHLSEADTIRFALPADGRYHVVTRAFRYLESDARAPENPEITREFVVVRDTTPPRLSITGAADVVLREWAGDATLAELHVADASGDGEPATPLSVEWEIGARGVGAALWRGSLRDLAPAVEPMRLTWADLLPATLEDGDYELRVRGSDVAGNQAQVGEHARYAFRVARSGPTLRLQNPEQRWLPRPGNRFRVIVNVEDANGVASVTCTVRSSNGRELGPRALELVDANASTWETEFELPPSWSETRVQLDCRACDSFGNESRVEPRTVAVDAFVVPRPASLALGVAGAPEVAVAPMRRVDGAARYTYGGRAERAEQTEFRRYGLTLGQRTLNRDEVVADFYLDETEVTVAQYLAFVVAADGYRSAVHWPVDAPREERRRQLEAGLRALPADLPVTGVDWDEATAYAHWIGKRLPTAVEWEYAVRGGVAAYRPYSCAREGVAVDASAFNVDLGETGSGAVWAVGRGADVTPDGIGAGIRNLCSNVSEWTASEARDGRRLVMGASYASLGAAYHCLVGMPLERGARRATIGFRCALDLERADAAMERDTDSRLHVVQGRAVDSEVRR